MSDLYGSGRWRVLAFALLTTVLFWIGSLIPPMQSPDEGTHLVRAYGISQGRWLATTPEGKMTGDMVDRAFLAYGLAGAYEWRIGPRQLTQERLSELAAMVWDPDGAEVFFESPGAAYYAPVVYLPHALGLAVGRWLGLTIEASLALVSLLASAATAALVVSAVAVWRPPPVVYAMLLLPMTIAQAASPTIDGITTGALLLGLALFLRSHAQRRRMSGATTMAFLLCFAVCATSRVHASVLLLLPFVLFLRTRQWSMLVGGLACAAGSLAWTVWAMVTTVDRRVARSMTTMESLAYFASSPHEFAGLLWRTLMSPQRQEQYLQSFIGIMGWLDAPLSAAQYAGLGWGLAAIALLSVNGRGRGHWRVRVVLTGCGLLSALLVFVALAVTFTDWPAATVDGIQGRYFLLPAIVVAFGLFWGRSPADPPALSPLHGMRARLSALAISVMAVACLAALFDVLDTRFQPGTHPPSARPD